ncbi:MAG: hypothetical protein KF819_16825 [Labilithrix sp.]|nr:hypothetical protein [Labilithrix sp.]
MRRLLLFFFVLLVACSKREPPLEGDATRTDESALRADDRRALERVVGIDVKASRAMREADDAARAGDAGAAASILSTQARPAIDEAIRAAASVEMKTEWGRAKRDEVMGILRDRKAEIPKYEEAVTSGDPEKMLAAIQAQAAIERRALTTVAAVHEGR